MPEVDEKILAFVETALDQDPEIPLAELYERAMTAIPSVGELNKRQFNARYPLQVKRRRALAARAAGGGTQRSALPGRGTVSPPGAALTPARDSVRQILFQFATDLAAAEERKDLVEVLAGVDRYVDQIMEV